MENQRNLFFSKRFLPLFVTQFLGAFNDNAFKNAFLIWFTYDVATYHGLDASIMLTFASGLFILPFFLFSAAAGQISDKYEKSWLAQKIKIAEIILMFGCALFFFMKSVTGLLFILFLMGVQSTFFGPIKYSLLPEHLQENELIKGNAWIEGATFFSILLGTVFGGVIIALPNGAVFLAIFVILFAITGYISSLSIPKAHIPEPNLKISFNFIKGTAKTISYGRKEDSVWFAILASSWFWYLGITFLTLFPVYTSRIIGGSEFVVTFFMTLFSVGIGFGSALCNKVLKGEISSKFVPSATLLMSLCIIVFFVASRFYLTGFTTVQGEHIGIFEFFRSSWWSIIIVGSILGLSVCGGMYIVPFYAIMQHYADKQYIARVIAAHNITNSLFMVLASIFSSIMLIFGFDVLDIFLFVGIINFVVFVIIAASQKKKDFI